MAVIFERSVREFHRSKKTSAITIDDLPVEAKVNDWSIYVHNIYIYI